MQIVEICLKIGVTPINDKIRTSRLRWLGHEQRRVIYATMRKTDLFQVERMKD